MDVNKELRNIYTGMMHRCANPNSPSFRHYGARGITVCERWRNSFEAFAADMGPRPSPNHSLDRINNDGNYEPGNCRWATWLEQARNRRRGKVEAPPGHVSLGEAAAITGLSLTAVWRRVSSGEVPADESSEILAIAADDIALIKPRNKGKDPRRAVFLRPRPERYAAWARVAGDKPVSTWLGELADAAVAKGRK